MDDTAPIRVGISACLLGQKVRFDGGHKKDDFISGTLSRFVTLVPVCPEVEMGLGTPREAIRLVRLDGLDGLDGAVRLRGVQSEADHTAAMRRYAAGKVRELARLDLCGYILMQKSPSCGLFRVKVYDENAVPSKTGRGLFAAALTEALPQLPVEEQGRLGDARLRENFLERVFAYRRLRALFGKRWSTGDLVRFHTREKMLVLAHDRPAYERLGRLVAGAGARGKPRKELAELYSSEYMTALAKPATTRTHTNVLRHLAGYFKKLLGPAERAELDEVITDFHRALVPLVVPMTLIRHYTRLHAVEYLLQQAYLDPHPKELMLRNHV